MTILVVLIPVTLLLVGAALWAFFWATNDGQFDDLDRPAVDILIEDDPSAPRNAIERTEGPAMRGQQRSDGGIPADLEAASLPRQPTDDGT